METTYITLRKLQAALRKLGWSAPYLYSVHGMRGPSARNDDGTTWQVEARLAANDTSDSEFVHDMIQASCSLRHDGAAYCYSQARRAGWKWLGEVAGLIDKSRAFRDTVPGTLANEIGW
jgi:hypothetical protein